MDLQQTKALKNYFHKGFIVLLQGERVIDMEEITSAGSIRIRDFEEEDKDYYTIETDGYIYSTRVISISDVEVLIPLDWNAILRSSDYELPYELIGNPTGEITDYVEDLKNAYDEAGD